jgi:Tol biopolymer transport system component
MPPPGLVARITTLTEDGGRVAWSASLNRIAFDRAGADGYFDIWTMNPDGSAQTCITCGRPGFPTRHIGQPAWHPSGSYIAFQGQKEGLTGALVDFLANPGSGLNNDLFVMDAGGNQLWRLVNVPAGPGGILHPQFSHSGRELLWTERIANVGLYGQWVMRLASFQVVNGVPTISNIRTYTPGAQQIFYETHGFSPDDQELLFSGNLEAGSSELGIDIYRYHTATGRLLNLTSTPTEWDEHAHFSPSGTRIAWMSSRGFPPVSDAQNLRTEFWLMNADGSGKTQLTHFNEPGQPESIPGQAVAGDLDWSPDGRRIVGYVVTQPAQIRGKIVMIDLNIVASTESSRTEVPLSETATPPVPNPAPSTLAGSWLEFSVLAGDDDLGRVDDLMNAMRSDGTLAQRSVIERPESGYRVVRYEQRSDGLPVLGADAVAQYSARGRLVAAFGSLRQACAAPASRVSRDEATASAARQALLVGEPPLTPVVVPQPDGSCASAYVGRGIAAPGPVQLLVDGASGAVQILGVPGGVEAVGTSAPASAGNRSHTTVVGGRYYAHDTSRSPGIVTLDLASRAGRTAQALRSFTLADVASDADGVWDDDLVAAFQSSAASAYDTIASQFGWRGVSRSVPLVGLLRPGFGTARGAAHGSGPFHVGNGLVVVPETRAGASAVTAASVGYAMAQAIVDQTSRLALEGEAGALRATFAALVSGRTSGGHAGPAAPGGSMGVLSPDVALQLARARLAASADAAYAGAVDRLFFTAVVEALPARATSAMARDAMVLGARQSFGLGSLPEAAVRAGWAGAGIAGKSGN